MNNKKGDLTANQIITIIILIVSFSIIILFFFMLNLEGDIDKESCRSSVVLRSSIPGGSSAINLKCSTQEVCFYKSGECKESGKDTLKIEVSTKEELLDELSDLMYDCHWQMGGGKMDYLPSNWLATKNYCSICNVIYFENAIKQDAEMSKIPVREVFLYLKGKKAPGTDNSMLYEMSGYNTLESIGIDKLGEAPYNFSYDGGYIIANSLTKKGWLSTWVSGGTATVVGGVILFALGPPGWIIGTGIAVAGAAAGGVAYFVTGPGDTYYSPPALLPNDPQTIKDKLNCNDFTTLA